MTLVIKDKLEYDEMPFFSFKLGNYRMNSRNSIIYAACGSCKVVQTF